MRRNKDYYYYYKNYKDYSGLFLNIYSHRCKYMVPIYAWYVGGKFLHAYPLDPLPIVEIDIEMSFERLKNVILSHTILKTFFQYFFARSKLSIS